MKRKLSFLICFVMIVSLGFSQQNPSYRVSINGNNFVPAENYQQIKQEVKANQVSNVTTAYKIIQFKSIPTLGVQKTLKPKGITLLNYISGNAYFALVDKSFYNEKNLVDNILSISDYKSEYKISEALKSDYIPSYAKSNGKTKIVIFYYDNVEKTQIQEDLKKLQIVANLIYEFKHIYAEVTNEELEAITSLNWVMTVDLIPQPPVLENLFGRNLTKSHVLNSNIPGLGYGLTGKNVNIGIWDADVESHRDFNGRITQREYKDHQSAHGTHVAGTVAGGGVLDPKTKGCAPDAKIFSWNFSDNSVSTTKVYQERDSCAKWDKIVMTQNSWGYGLSSCPANRAYDADDNGDDYIANKYPYLLHVFSNGNSQSVCPDGFKTTTKNLKNSLLVGAIDYIDNMSGFSSFGPSKDGRLFPNICAFGVDVYSCSFSNKYEYMSGTSMATPNVTGTMALLYQRYIETHAGAKPLSSLMKALVCNTAYDLGNVGPDYKYGYGEINAYRALQVMEKKQFYTNSVSQGTNHTQTITVPAGAIAVRVMVAWTDKAGTVGAAKALVNDLDLTVNNGTTYLPWKLNPAIPSNPAIKGIDSLNNIEQVVIDNPTAGTYTIKVNGSVIPSGSQEFSVVYDIVMSTMQVVYPIGGESFDPSDVEVIRWDYEGVAGTFNVEYSIDGGVNYTPIAVNLPVKTRSYAWTVPQSISKNVKIRVSRGAMFDETKGLVNIMHTPKNISAPANICDGSGFYTITWNDVSNAKYHVYKAVGQSYEFVAEVTDNRFVISNLQPGIDNIYAVKAIDLTTGAISERSLAAMVSYTSPITSVPVTINFDDQNASKFYLYGKNGMTSLFKKSSWGLLFQAPLTESGWDDDFTSDEQCFELNANNVHSATSCNINTAALAGKKMYLEFDMSMGYGSNVRNSIFRLKVNGTVVPDGDGRKYIHASFDMRKIYYDLTAYAGQNITLAFEYVGKAGFSFFGLNYFDEAFIDNIKISEPVNDLKLVGIDKFTTTTNAENVNIHIQNTSGNAITNLPVRYYISKNGVIGSWVTDVIPGPIEPLKTFDYTFTQKANLSDEAQYTVKADINQTDFNNSNNSQITIATSNGNTILMGKVASPIVDACGRAFADKGGKFYNYFDYLKDTLTIYPTAGTNLKVKFTEFSLMTSDILSIYNGNSVNSPLIGNYTILSPDSVVSSAVDGSLTFVFYSNTSTNSTGWYANLSCVAKTGTDALAVSLITPNNSTCLRTNNETITARFGNAGATNLTNVPVYYQINSGTAVNAVLPTLNAGAFVDYVFTQKADLSAPGNFSVKVGINAVGDANSSNNSITNNLISGCCLIPAHTNTNGYGISKLTWGTFVKSSGLTSYSDFTSDIIDVSSGGTYDPKLEMVKAASSASYNVGSSAYGLFTLVVVDWDNDGDFADNFVPNECYVTSYQSTSAIQELRTVNSFLSGMPSSANLEGVVIPSGYSAGPKRMRIITMYRDAYQSYKPCLGPTVDNATICREDFEVEEYTLNYQLAPDAGISSIISPAGATFQAINVVAQIKNFGGLPLTNIPVKLELDGIVKANETYIGTLQPGETVDYTFTQSISLASSGSHTIKVSTAYFGDNSTANDSKTKSITTPLLQGTNVVGTFDGIDDMVNISAKDHINLINNFSFEAWINVTEYPKDGLYSRIFDKDRALFYIAGNGTLYNDSSLIFLSYDENGSSCAYNTPNGTIKKDQWHHVALTMDASNNLKIYVDGVDLPLTKKGLQATIADNASNGLVLGNRNAKDRGFKGQMDEVRFWNKVLTATEISSKMNTSLSGNETNLIAYYKFAEGAGSNVIDFTKYYNSGIIANADYSGIGEGKFWNAPKLFISNIDVPSKVVPVTYDAVNNQYNTIIPIGSSLNSLKPTFVLSANAVAKVNGIAQTSGVSSQNFTNPVTYTIEGAGLNAGITQTVKLGITVDLSSEAECSVFKFLKVNNPSLSSDLILTKNGNSFTTKVAYGTSISSLKGSYTISNNAQLLINDVAQTNPQTTAMDYTVPVMVNVVSQNQRFVNTYKVFIDARNNAANLTTFNISGQIGVTTIDNTKKTISIVMPNGTNLSTLMPTYTVSANANVNANGIAQNSGLTIVDFTNPVVYNVISEDGTTSNSWTVYVTINTNASNKTKILAFNVPNQEGNTKIDTTNYAVSVKMPFGTSVANIIPTFVLSTGATAKIGATTQVSGVTSNNFTIAKTYTITAENGTSTQNWNVNVEAAKNYANDITAYTISGGTTQIDAANKIITVTVPLGTNLTNLKPTFSLSSGATAKISGVVQQSNVTTNDYTSAVLYDVYAENGTSIATWTVKVLIPNNNEANIVSYSLPGQIGNSIINTISKTITVTMPYGTSVNSLIATYTLSSGATAKVGNTTQISGSTANNFTNPVVYAVTAADGTTTQNWTVTVNVQASNQTDITAYSIANQVGNTVINNTNKTIAVTMPYGTSVNNLIATFTLSSGATAKVGNTTQVSGTTANNFTNPVVYTITAADGTTTQNWTVTVNVQASNQTDITAYSIANQVGNAVINNTNKTIAVTMPYGTNVSSLVATFTLSNGATAKVGITTQVSGTTANNFTNPVVYTITAADGTTTQNWIVTVNVQASNQTDITAYSIANQVGNAVINITNKTIAVTMPYGTNVSSLIATYTLSSGANAKVGITTQVSGTTANNFTNLVVYTITAADGTTTQNWTVTVNVELPILVNQINLTAQGGVNGISTNGGTLQILADVLPSNANNKTIVWSVVNGTGEATINETGLLQAVSNGTVTVRATAQDGSNIIGELIITISNQGSGHTELTDVVVSVYPNPAIDYVVIELSENTKWIISILDVNGKLISTKNIEVEKTTLDISQLQEGVYNIIVTKINSNQSIVRRIVIQ